jgi:hypothetical protein
MDIGEYIYEQFLGKSDNEVYLHFQTEGLSELGDNGNIALQLLHLWKMNRDLASKV